jgi:hypothetical protein
MQILHIRIVLYSSTKALGDASPSSLTPISSSSPTPQHQSSSCEVPAWFFKDYLFLRPINLPLPIANMLAHNLGRTLRRILPPYTLHEVPLRIHNVEVNTMIDQIVLARLHVLRRAEIHAVHLAHVLRLLVGPREADELRVELVEVVAEDEGGVARRVAGYEEGPQDGAVLGGYDVDCAGHFVELVGADVGAVGEAEVYLRQIRGWVRDGGETGRTMLYFPLRFSSVNLLPFISVSSKGPPTLGFPTPLDISTIRLRSSRAFSYRK